MKKTSIITRSNFTKWRWKYNRVKSYVMPLCAVPVTDKLYTIKSNSGRVLVSLSGNKLTISRHYHFDGATRALDLKSGLEWYAVHDAMCQLAAKYDEITIDMADAAFDPRLRHGAPLHIWIYYAGIRLNRKLKIFTS